MAGDIEDTPLDTPFDIENTPLDISASIINSNSAQLSKMYTSTEDTDDDNATLYKMQYGSLDNAPFCVICLDTTTTPYGCFQCKECIICEDCIDKLNPKHRKKCPVCRKGKKWCKIIQTNKAYILNNDETEVIRENIRRDDSYTRNQELNTVFKRGMSFIICIFLPFLVFMGLKLVYSN